MMVMDDTLTAGEAAERLGYTVQHVRRLLREGRLRGTKVGRDWVVLDEAVKEFAGHRENFQLLFDD